MGFRRWVLRKLGFSASHCEIFQRKKRERERKAVKGRAKTKLEQGKYTEAKDR